MKNGLLTKRIPTLLGVVVLLVGLAAGVFLVGRQQLLGTQAGPTSLPRNVKIVNRGSNSLTVTWISDVPVTGFVKYSDNPARLTLPAGDARDQISGNTNQYTTHFVDINGLTADKTYYFEIGSGSQMYNDGGKPYQVRTAPAGATPAEDVTSGKILNVSNSGVGGALVYVDITGAETLGTLTKNDGSFRLALSNARDSTGKFVAYDKAKENVTIFVQAGGAGTATALTNTATDNPVPDITLGKTHNFAGGEIVPETVSSLSSGSNTATNSGFANISDTSTVPSITSTPEATYSVKMTYPLTDGEKIATTSPVFLGTGPIGTLLSLSITSTLTSSSSGVATVSAQSKWQWPSPKVLPLGRHTINLSWKEGATSYNFKRMFEIVAAGSIGGLPSFTSTPSATPTASSSGRTTMPSTVSGIPEPGLLTPTVWLLIVGIGLFFGGIIWKKQLLTYLEKHNG